LKILISASDLRKNFEKYTIVDLRSKQEYDTAHIKGAVSLPVGDAPLKTDDGGFPSAGNWAGLLGGLGITRDAKIVAYDDGKSGRAVARFWYVAKYYGHGEVLILNGGFSAATALPMSADAAKITPSIYATNITEGYIFGLNEVLENYGKMKFLDVRTMEEFTGDDLRDNPRGGHLRGAILAPVDNFFADAPGQSFASPDKLAQAMTRLGIRKEDFIVTY